MIWSSVTAAAGAASGAFAASSVTKVMTIFSSIGASAFFGSSFLNGSFPSNPVAINVIPIFCPKVGS